MLLLEDATMGTALSSRGLRSVLVPLPPVHWGGLQAFAANLNSALRAAGWRWIVAVPTNASDVIERLRNAGVDVLAANLARLRRSPLESLQSLARMPGELRDLAERVSGADISLVQAVGAHHLHGAILATTLKKPLVWQIHSSILPSAARRVIAPFISSRADAIMTNGRQVGKAFWGRRAAGAGHFVFYAPVDTARYATNIQARRDVRKRLGYPDTAIVVGTVGNRVWQKNHVFLMAAAAELAHFYPKLRFLVLGAKSANYQQEYERKVQIPALHLNQQYPGFVQFIDPGEAVDQWIQALDIFTLTSHAEGVPIALFEAMSAGKPVVASDVGSICEIVLEGQTGFLYPPGDLYGYCQILCKLLEHPDELVRLGISGRTRITSQFSIANVVEAHVSAYEAAMCGFRSRD